MITVGGHTFDETIIGNGVIIDVGCRGFVFTDYFKNLGKKVFAVDPDPIVFADRVAPDDKKYICAAIAETSGESGIYLNGEGTVLKELDPDQSHPFIPCKTITMDDLYKITGTNVDILKLDCEGAEYMILGEQFVPIPKQISVEFHHHCVPELHAQKYNGIIQRLSQHYTMHNAVWEKRHGCGYNFWDTLFIRKT